MGRFDRRNSSKMRRRTSQAKKKEREARRGLAVAQERRGEKAS